jgi:hypothetical protein
MTATLKSVILLVALTGITSAHAQVEDKNLVKNPGFENTQGKIEKR